MAHWMMVASPGKVTVLDAQHEYTEAAQEFGDFTTALAYIATKFTVGDSIISWDEGFINGG